MIDLAVRHLSKKYTREGRAAVDDISFELESGQILTLVGPSGCGKTTTLRLIAGLEIPDSGEIHLNDRLVVSDQVFTPPEQRGIGMVFQDHALFPHLTVYENVAFGIRKIEKTKKQATVLETLDLVGLAGLTERYPHALSGGERQRVALARALAPRPVLLLMDEPFSSLDADLRMQVREQVRGILKSLHATAIFVTHDQEEALFMGDRLAVLQDGGILQIGAPQAVFHASQTRFVAEFLGGSDFVDGEIRPDGIWTAMGVLPQTTALPVGTRVEIACRADDVDFRPQATANGQVDERFFVGAYYIYRLKLDSGQAVHAFKPHTELWPIGERVQIFFSAGHPLTVFLNGTAVPEL